MSPNDTATLILSGLAIFFSIITAIYSGYLSVRLASSDYKAKEQVKEDTAKLLAALRSIMHKGALSSSTNYTIDISCEKTVISEFMNSQTGFAYYSWVDEKNSDAQKKGTKSESWRLFFLYLAELANSDDVYRAARRAADTEILFDGITKKEISKIARFNSNLIIAIEKNSKNREGNIIIKAFVDSQKEKNSENSQSDFVSMLNYLKGLGIKDPDIDMFLAVISNNVPALEEALKAGANPKTTDSALLNKYADKLKNYKKS
jgi:hypothetical protein